MAKRVPELAKKNGLWRFEKRSSYLGFFFMAARFGRDLEEGSSRIALTIMITLLRIQYRVGSFRHGFE